MKPILTLASAVVLLLAAPALAGRVDALDPGPNLSVDGLPPVPSGLVEAVRPYAEIRGAAFRSWHPARREMLISTRFSETDQIHLVDRPGGDRRQLTFLPEPIGWASFDPRGGSSFVFSSDTGGDEFFQLYRYDLADGRITLLTDGSKRHFGGPWSNRGDRILFDRVDADAEGAFTEIWVVDPRVPDSKRKVTTLRGGGWGLADWSLDDSQLLLEEQVSARESSLWLIDIATGRQRRVTPDPAAGKVVWSNGRFADDGRSLFVSTNSGGEFRQLALLQIEEGKLEILTPDLQWDVTAVELSPAGSVLAFLTNEGGWSRLYLLDTTTRLRRAVGALPAGVATGLRWHENGKELAVTVSSARISGDVFVVDAPSLRVERWTHSETGGLDPATFVEPTDIEWPSFDGRRISGFLYQPNPARFAGKRPVIVDIHGGPEGQSRPDFRGASNFWVSELGVAVLYPNVRGSTGYGKTFVGLDDGFGREGSYEDIRTPARLDREEPASRRRSRHGHRRQLRRPHDVRRRHPDERPHPLCGAGGRNLQPPDLPRAHPGLPARPAPRRVRRRARSEDARVPGADRAAQSRRLDPQADLRRPRPQRPSRAVDRVGSDRASGARQRSAGVVPGRRGRGAWLQEEEQPELPALRHGVVREAVPSELTSRRNALR